MRPRNIAHYVDAIINNHSDYRSLECWQVYCLEFIGPPSPFATSTFAISLAHSCMAYAGLLNIVEDRK